jgi:uncharacterized membrane protein
MGRPRHHIDSTGRLRDILSSVKRFVPALILLTLALPAEAALGVCNKTTHATDVALGFYDGKDWSSQGWWTIPAGACAQLMKETLPARYYYLYAVQHDVGGGWDGEHGFCVRGGQFQIPGHVNCAKRGFDRKGFFQVDTGNAPDWTENLAD